MGFYLWNKRSTWSLIVNKYFIIDLYLYVHVYLKLTIMKGVSTQLYVSMKQQWFIFFNFTLVNFFKVYSKWYF